MKPYSEFTEEAFQSYGMEEFIKHASVIMKDFITLRNFKHGTEMRIPSPLGGEMVMYTGDLLEGIVPYIEPPVKENNYRGRRGRSTKTSTTTINTPPPPPYSSPGSVTFTF